MNAMNALEWQLCRFDDLPIRDWYAVSAVRIDVFVLEQNCPFQDLDGADLHSWHLLGWYAPTDVASERKLAGYCRIVDPGVKFDQPSIGRVVTAREFRARGYGQQLVAEACARHDLLYPYLPSRIGAQARLEKFYQGFGYVTDSEPYLEDGIWHLEMQRAAKSPRSSQ